MQYFDKTFFQFLFGFVAIIFVSLAVVLAISLFEEFQWEQARNTNSAGYTDSQANQ